jgi:hypothetical protein
LAQNALTRNATFVWRINGTRNQNGKSGISDDFETGGQKMLKLEPHQVLSRTVRNKARTDGLREKLHDYDEDICRSSRLEAQNCKYCTYIDSRIGGCAFTNSECRICGAKIINGSTCVDIVCEDCAKKNELCKHCGGDIDDRVNRVVTEFIK